MPTLLKHHRILYGVLGLSLVLMLIPVACDVSDQVNAPEPTDNPANDDPAQDDFMEMYADVDGDGLYHNMPDCTACHDVFGFSGNLRFVPDYINTPNSGPRAVVFTARQGPNSFADGDSIYDGICEVCHTTTTYHRNNEGGLHTHYSGYDCIICHTHLQEFAPSGGAGGPSHTIHTAGSAHGLALDCEYCHLSDLSSFQDGEPFATTHVCDECHSPDGVFDGVDDLVIGARTNWAAGIYDGDSLQTGKERWCAACHDQGSSVINGVAAPAVAGDGTWGFFASGHGRNDAVFCDDCHDALSLHCDGVAHTYSAAEDNYQTGFRLADLDGLPPLTVPRTGFDWDDPYTDPPYYDLCFSCHNKYLLLGAPTAPAGPYNIPEMRTNFRSDSTVIIPDGLDTDIAQHSVSGAVAANSHYRHLTGPPHFFDSDHDGAADSYGSCVACHNVHGSTSAAMIRDGKLIGFEPGLNFSRVRYDRHDPGQGGCGDPIIMTSADVLGPESHGGVMRSSSGPAANGVCNFCHCSGANTGDPEYVINCYDPDCVDYYRVYVTPPEPTVR